MSEAIWGRSLRAQPANIEAEQALLGAILASNKAYDRVSAYLEADHFHDPLHAKVYALCARRIEQGQLADAVTLKGELDRVGEDGSYLASLLSAMVGITTVSEYGRAIYDAWVRRQVISIGEAAVAGGFGDTEGDTSAVIEQLSDQLAALAEQAPGRETGRRGPVLLADAIATVTERAEAVHRGEVPGLTSTGVEALDVALGGGIAPATLIYLAGLESTGKTELAMQVAEHMAAEARRKWLQHKQGACPGAIYISLGDMTAEQIAARSAARLGAIPLAKIRRGELDAATAEGLLQAQAAALEVPVEIADQTNPSGAGVRGEVMRFLRRRPCVLAVIDNYTDLLSNTRPDDKMVALKALAIMSDVMLLAKRTGVPVLMLMHLGQDVAKRPGSVPRWGDIPWGANRKCDAAVAIHRPVLALGRKPPTKPEGLNEKGEERYSKMVNDWYLERERLRYVTEFITLKSREDEGGDGGAATQATFDPETRSFS